MVLEKAATSAEWVGERVVERAVATAAWERE
jgi:hypothetical protein